MALETAERKLISVPRAAKQLGIAPEALRRAIARGELPCTRLNGRPWLAQRTVNLILTEAGAAPADGNSDSPGGREPAKAV